MILLKQSLNSKIYQNIFNFYLDLGAKNLDNNLSYFYLQFEQNGAKIRNLNFFNINYKY